MEVHKNAPLTPLGREHMVKMVLSGQTPQANRSSRRGLPAHHKEVGRAQ
jgi:hypothetical protein